MTETRLDNPAQDLFSTSRSLDDAREAMNRIREEVRTLAPSIKKVDDSIETAQAIDTMLEAARSFVDSTKIVRTRMDQVLMRSGDLNGLAQRLNNLRQLNRRYRDAFDDLWRSAIGIQVEAFLKTVGRTKEEVWRDRWGDDCSAAVEVMPKLGIKEVQEREFLLTLRYLRYPGPQYTAYSEIAHVFDISPPLALQRQIDTETQIVIRLIKDAAKRDGILSDEEKDSDGAGQAGASTSLRRTTPAKSDLPNRSLRYMAVLDLWDQRNLTPLRVLVRVLGGTSGNSEEENDDGAIIPEYLAKTRLDIIVLYAIGQSKSIYLPHYIAENAGLEQAQGLGFDSIERAWKVVLTNNT